MTGMSILYFKFKRGVLELKDDGFLMIDTLLALLTFSVIVTVLVPALLSLERLDQLTSEQLAFSRDVYLHLMNNDAVIIDDQFFTGGAICRDDDKKMCFE